MGGEITITSDIGVGTTIQFTVPLEHAEVCAETKSRTPSIEQAQPASILLVEDLPEDRDLVLLFLHDTPFNVTWASNGMDAIKFSTR